MVGSRDCADPQDPGRTLEPDDQLLTITVDAIVTLRGELDRSVEDDVTRRVAVAAQSADRIEIDAREVTFFDAAGVRAFLLSKQNAFDHGATVSFRFARPGPIERVLQVLGLIQLFPEPVHHAETPA